MTFYQHGDRSGDRPGQVPKVDGDSCPCVVTRTGPHLTRVDAILAAIDTGLQTAGDTAYGDDWPGTCWRCGEPAEDLCAGCREVLSDETTAEPPPLSRGTAAIYAFVAAHVAACPLCQATRDAAFDNQPNYARSITQ